MTKPLSEAMREGAKIRPQWYGSMFGVSMKFSEETEGVGSCALGAAYEAVHGGYVLAPQNSTVLYADFPILAQPCEPPCDCADVSHADSSEDLRGVIIHLNDAHCWTREQIADFVEQFESSSSPVS